MCFHCAHCAPARSLSDAEERLLCNWLLLYKAGGCLLASGEKLILLLLLLLPYCAGL